jgi:hypothetical protein
MYPYATMPYILSFIQKELNANNEALCTCFVFDPNFP